MHMLTMDPVIIPVPFNEPSYGRLFILYLLLGYIFHCHSAVQVLWPSDHNQLEVPKQITNHMDGDGKLSSSSTTTGQARLGRHSVSVVTVLLAVITERDEPTRKVADSGLIDAFRHMF